MLGTSVASSNENSKNRSYARHLDSFISEHNGRCARGYVVSRCPYTLTLNDTITAIPWWAI